MKTRYAVTYINKDGMRQLARANQGQNHFDTEADARHHIAAMLKNNSADTLESVYNGKAGVESLDVRPVQCYDHGDAVGIYFD